MRRPKRYEVGAGIAGVALGAAIGVAVEGGVPEVVKANVPPDNGRNSGAAVGVEESQQAAIAVLRDKIKIDAPKSVETVGGGEPPEPEGDSTRETTDSDNLTEAKEGGFGIDDEIMLINNLQSDIIKSFAETFPSEWDDKAKEYKDRYSIIDHGLNRKVIDYRVGSYSYFFLVVPNPVDGTVQITTNTLNSSVSIAKLTPAMLPEVIDGIANSIIRYNAEMEPILKQLDAAGLSEANVARMGEEYGRIKDYYLQQIHEVLMSVSLKEGVDFPTMWTGATVEF